jgi:alpha-tubulin suppressor-like RCC1 family protein
VASVEIVPQELTLFPSDQAQLDAELRDAKDNVLTGRTVTWTSSDTTVADVDPNGLVDAGSTFDSTMITAESEGVSDSITVDVVKWEQISAGYSFSCGVLTNGRAYCWGQNSPEGRLGDGTTDSSTSTDPDDWVGDADKNEPTAVEGGISFEKVVTGFWHACGLNKTGEVYCWGYGGAGALGDGTGSDSAVPVKVSGGIIFEDVVLGANHSCALTPGGDAYCWGYNASGQIGLGTSTLAYGVPQRIQNHQFEAIAAGANHNCGITAAGDAYCWGENDVGQIGNGANDNKTEPVAVTTSEQFDEIGTGWAHSCGRNTAGEIYCWGGNQYGQLGDGSITDRNLPDRADPSSTYEQLLAGGSSTCGLDANADAYCWGFNGQGNLGTGGFEAEQTNPTVVSGGYAWNWLSLGGNHTCAIADQEVDAYCWGDNENGQVGEGTDGNDITTPAMVTRP